MGILGGGPELSIEGSAELFCAQDEERSDEKTKKKAGSNERSRPAFDSEVTVMVWARLARWLVRVRQPVLVRRLAQARRPELVQWLVRVELPAWVRRLEAQEA